MRALAVVLLLVATPVVAAEAQVADIIEGLLARASTTGSPRVAGPLEAGPADAGYGVRTEDYPCYVATIVRVFHVSFDGVPRDGLTLERTVLAPEPDLPCGAGSPSWIGEGRAIIHEDAYDWIACTAFEGAFGGWAMVSDPCHVADFAEATITGRVGFERLADCWQNVCVTLNQVVGGTNNAPGHADVAFIRVA